MGRWKLLDNLRRSLAAPAGLLALLVAWLQPTPMGSDLDRVHSADPLLPPLLPALAGIVPRRAGVTLRNHLRTLRGDFALGLLQSAFLLTFLAHQAWLMVDAVGRTLFRLFVRRRHLLEWTTAAQAKDDDSFDHRSLAWQIGASVVSAGVVAIVLYSVGQRSWPTEYGAIATTPALTTLAPICHASLRWSKLSSSLACAAVVHSSKWRRRTNSRNSVRPTASTMSQAWCARNVRRNALCKRPRAKSPRGVRR